MPGAVKSKVNEGRSGLVSFFSHRRRVINTGSSGIEKVLRYMFEQGFLTEEQALVIGDITPAELKEWVGTGHVASEKSFFDVPTLYFPTDKAHRFLWSNGIKVYVEWLRRPPEKNEVHDRRLTDLRILFEKMGYLAWQSERCLHQRGMRKIRPDAIVEISKRKVVIELEMTMKGSSKYEKRFRFYADHPAIDAVLYVVATPEQRKRILKLSEGQGKVFVALLRNVSEHGRDAYVEHPVFPGAVRLWKFLEMIGVKRFLNAHDFQSERRTKDE